MEKWNFDSISDQHGKVALITGANSGIGYQASLMLAKKGVEVILACRDVDKGKRAVDSIRSAHPAAKVFLVTLDLADLESISECADIIKNSHNQLDLLINNAGVMIPPFSHTKQGFELQFGTNHLGHFALTGRLLSLLMKTIDSRVVSVSSLAASIYNYLDFSDLNWEHKRYRKWQAYGQSKLADLMFIRELANRLETASCSTMAVAAHPGGLSTNLQRTSNFFMRNKKLTSLYTHTPDKAALSILKAACDPTVKNGSYWGPSGLFMLTGSPDKAKIPAKALNAELTEQLWVKSEQLTGVKFDFNNKRESILPELRFTM